MVFPLSGPRPGSARSHRAYERLLALFSLRPGEVARTLLAFAYLFLIIAAYLLIKAIRNAYFISEFGALKLPYAMLGIAILTGVLVSLYIRLARRIPAARLTVYSLVFFAANIAVFWWLAVRSEKWLYPILYVWSGIFGVVATAQVWTLANELFTVREAKRVFGVVGAGGILGAALGGSAAFRLAPVLGTDHLLLVVAALLLVAAGTVAALVRLRTAQVPVSGAIEPPRNLKESLRAITGSSHLRLLASLVFVTALATTTVDFQFNVVAGDHIRGRDQLTGFFGAVYGSTSVIAFVLQVLLTSRMLTHLGVGISILLLPLSLISGTTALVMTKAIWAGVLLKGSDGALKHSLDRSCRELMYLPVPQHVKVQAKSTIDTVMDRMGDGVAGAIQLLIIEGFGFGLRGSLALNFLVVGVWLTMALRLKRRYVDQLRDTLAGSQPEPGALDGIVEEADARHALEEMLSTGAEDRKLAALDWAARARVPLDETLLLLLARSDPSPAVRRSALASLLGGAEAEIPTDMLASLEEEGRSALVAAIDVVVREDEEGKREVLEGLLERTGGASRLPLVAFMARRLGPEFEPFADRVFEALLAAEVPAAARREAARALALFPSDSLPLRRLDDLLLDPDPDVAAAAAESAARRGRSDALPRIVSLLGRARARAAARSSILAFGAAADSALIAALREPDTPPAVARQIPRLLAAIGTPPSLEMLVAAIHHRDGVVAGRSLRALTSLRRRNPEIRPLHGASLVREILKETHRYRNAAKIRRELGDGYGPGGPLEFLGIALEIERDRAFDAVFDLLALDFPPDEIRRARHLILSGSPAERANAVELLSNVLPRAVERELVPLMEARFAREIRASSAFGDLADLLREAAHSPNPWVAACVLCAARRSAIAGLEDAAERGRRSSDPALREEAERYLEPPGVVA